MTKMLSRLACNRSAQCAWIHQMDRSLPMEGARSQFHLPGSRTEYVRPPGLRSSPPLQGHFLIGPAIRHWKIRAAAHAQMTDASVDGASNQHVRRSKRPKTNTRC